MLDCYNYVEQLELYGKVLTQHFPFDKQHDIYTFLSQNLERYNQKLTQLIIDEYTKSRPKCEFIL
jgi:hypothetical protein